MAESKSSTRAPRVTSELLDEVKRGIVDRFHPERIILFGSHARGEAGEESDVDLLVVMESDLRPAQRSAAVSLACRPRFIAMDILVLTPEEVRWRLEIGDHFIRRIVDEGRVLYER